MPVHTRYAAVMSKGLIIATPAFLEWEVLRFITAGSKILVCTRSILKEHQRQLQATIPYMISFQSSSISMQVKIIIIWASS